jgi:hypothetical protein
MSDSVFRGESPSVIVSESLGRLIADGENAIGHRISDWTSQRRVLMRQGPPDYLEVVGVVPDLITSVRSTAPLVAYQPIPPDLAVGGRGTLLIVRAADDPDSAMREVIAAARALDPQVTLENMMTLDQQIGREMTPQRFAVYILGSLGGIALLLTVLGTYTITKSMVIRRRRELGIRTALGAGRANLGRLVLTDTARLVGIGIVCGLGVAALGARFIRSLLYQVQPLDPLVLAAASALMLGLALLVSLGPVLEATRLDITRSLREE